MVRGGGNFLKRAFRIFPGALIAAVMLAGVSGCDNPVQPEKTGPGNRIEPDAALANRILEQVRKDLKENQLSLYTPESAIPPKVAEGSTKGRGILLIAHGGPEYKLFSMSRFGPLKAPNDEYFRVLVKQHQMVPGRVPKGAAISRDDAKEINLYSAATLFAAAEDFFDKGYRVVLYGSSFGAFLAAETIRLYGHEPFAKILIARGRLDMQWEITEGRFNGILKSFLDGTDIVPMSCGKPVRQEMDRRLSMFILQGDLNQHRYSKSARIREALPKIIYYSGGKDTRVGRLTEEEVDFLTGRSLKNGLGPNPGEGYQRQTVQLPWVLYESIKKDRTSGCWRTKIQPMTNVTRGIHIIQGLSGKAAVKYAPDDAHSIPSLRKEIQADIVRSFSG